MVTFFTFGFICPIILLQHPHFTVAALALISGSGCIHLAYFLLLQRGYRVGDFSLVYPLARGTGPLLSSILAILLFGERPIAFTGILLIVAGIIALAI